MLKSRKYTWQPQPADSRDYKFSLSATTLPLFVDPLGTNNKVEDQGNIGSCTGHAATTALEIVTGNVRQYSRLMAYYNGRLIENNVRYDDGAYLRDVIKGFKQYGVARETLWPYITSKFASKPTAAAYTNAAQLKTLISKYETVSTLAQMKTALAAGLPVIFGAMVTDQIETDAVATSGWLRYPTKTDYIVGGHALVAIGYDMRGPEPFMWVRNSWGPYWGINGNLKMPFKWFESNYVSDMWVIYPKSSSRKKVS